jgi:hypothetical protein
LPITQARTRSAYAFGFLASQLGHVAHYLAAAHRQPAVFSHCGQLVSSNGITDHSAINTKCTGGFGYKHPPLPMRTPQRLFKTGLWSLLCLHLGLLLENGKCRVMYITRHLPG